MILRNTITRTLTAEAAVLNTTTMSPEVTPYQISVPDSAIDSLQHKLAETVWPTEASLYNDWDFGVSHKDVKQLAAYWQDGFDWRKIEAKLNNLPQYHTSVEVDGFGPLGMHFVHQKSTRADAVPLLFVHGWPGSFLEVAKILPLLTDPEDPEAPAFHVLAPSLPNFGFSDGISEPGFGIPQYAEAVHKVMLAVGYNTYVTQAGDWGYDITRMTGLLYPESVLASHFNYPRVVEPPSLKRTPQKWLKHALTPYTKQEVEGLEATNKFLSEGAAYSQLQGTKPSTIGLALSESPVGLLGWIYEKLRGWTDEYPWTEDEVLTFVSIYWFSNAGPGSSCRIYYEATHSQQELTQRTYVWMDGPKLGFSWFPKDLLLPPTVWAEALGDVVFTKRHTSGGHFAAHEKPEALVEDLHDMFGAQGGARDVIQRLQNLYASS